MVLCRQHIHPSLGHAKRTHGFPYDLEVIYSLKFIKNHKNFVYFPLSNKCYAFRKRKLTPNVMNIVQATNLRKESGKWNIVCLTILDTSGPVISPFNHSTWFQTIWTHFIDMRWVSHFNLWPIAKCQHVLQMTWTQQNSTLFFKCLVILLKNEKEELDEIINA